MSLQKLPTAARDIDRNPTAESDTEKVAPLRPYL